MTERELRGERYRERARVVRSDVAVAPIHGIALCVQQLDPAEAAVDGLAEKQLQLPRRLIALRPRRRFGPLEVGMRPGRCWEQDCEQERYEYRAHGS